MHVSNNKDNIDWTNVVKKEVIGTDGLDLGEVVEIGDNFIVVQKGLLNKKRYIIPISTAESFDGPVPRLERCPGIKGVRRPVFRTHAALHVDES